MARSKDPMLGQSESFRHVLAQAGRVKGRLANVLLEGETGTGKELLARYLHQQEGNPKRPFVEINCAAIPDNLLESELFGHERGSFTDACQRKIGKFELAHGGDLFLDEVSCLKLGLQSKLLRALQEKVICRVGGSSPIPAEFRVIAATNENLEKQVEEGKFRLDLFHRLSVVPLRLPALRERKEDILMLATAFFRKFSLKFGEGRSWKFTPRAMEVLTNYAWPGNIRELENLVHSMVLLVDGPEIEREDLPEWVFRIPKTDDQVPIPPPETVPLKNYLAKVEQAYIQRALEIMRGDKRKAAALLDISPTRLYSRLKEIKVALHPPHHE